MVKKSITCISLLFIGCGISYFGIDYGSYIVDKKQNEIFVGKYFVKEKEEENPFVAILEIPKIKLKRGLYAIDNPLSNIDKNIIFLDKSDMPDVKNSRVIIVGHSGTPHNAYFNKLFKLKHKDKIYLYYEEKKYTYQITDIYEVIKCGHIAFESNRNQKTLTLVTCKGTNKQLVVVSTLIKEEQT